MARTPFKMKSGNSTPFKQMGSSPLHQGLKKEGKQLKKTEIGPKVKPMVDKNKNKISDFVESRESLEGKLDRPTTQYKPRKNLSPSKPKAKAIKSITPPKRPGLTIKNTDINKGTVKGRTGFQSDVVDPVRSKVRQGVKFLSNTVIAKGNKKSAEMIKKGSKKVKKYFTKK